MKKHWLRGMLLGVSLALLLAGGVAVAASLRVTVDQDCFECYPADYNNVLGIVLPPPEYVVVVTFDGYEEAELCLELYMNGELFWSWPCETPGHAPPCELWLWVDCATLGLHTEDTCFVLAPRAGVLDVGPSFKPAEYGDWVVRAWQEGDGQPVGPVREVPFTFAQVCEEEVEFVPEPGTIALLGSGLAGLAGYAALRWRGRQ